MNKKPTMHAPVAIALRPRSPAAIEQAAAAARSALERLETAGYHLRAAVELQEGEEVVASAKANYEQAARELLACAELALRQV